MKVKLAFLVQNEALNKLVDKPMDALTSFRIGKTVSSVQSELEAFEKTRQSLLEKYGTKTADGEGLEIKPEHKNWKHFVKEYEELVNEEVELDAKKIKISALKEVKMSAKDLIALDWLIEE